MKKFILPTILALVFIGCKEETIEVNNDVPVTYNSQITDKSISLYVNGQEADSSSLDIDKHWYIKEMLKKSEFALKYYCDTEKEISTTYPQGIYFYRGYMRDENGTIKDLNGDEIISSWDKYYLGNQYNQHISIDDVYTSTNMESFTDLEEKDTIIIYNFNWTLTESN